MWYEAAIREMGIQGNLDLEISLVPHAEDPERAVRQLREVFNDMMGKKNGERR